MDQHKDSALKEYIGHLVADVVVFHKKCSRGGDKTIVKFQALMKFAPFRTMPKISTMEKVVLVKCKKFLHLFDEACGGVLYAVAALGELGKVSDPILLQEDLKGKRLVFESKKPLLFACEGASSQPSKKSKKH